MFLLYFLTSGERRGGRGKIRGPAAICAHGVAEATNPTIKLATYGIRIIIYADCERISAVENSVRADGGGGCTLLDAIHEEMNI